MNSGLTGRFTAALGRDNAERVIRSIALVRAVVGGACLVVPALARVWVGPGGGSRAAKVLSRSLAARDLALGAGTAMAEGPELSRWAVLSGLTDAVDAFGTLMARRHLPKGRRTVIAVVSAVAAIAGSAAAASIPPPDLGARAPG